VEEGRGGQIGGEKTTSGARLTWQAKSKTVVTDLHEKELERGFD